MKRLIINLILVIALICFCFSAYKLGSYAWHTRQTKQLSSELSDLVQNDSAPDTLYRPGSYRLFAVVLDQVPEEGSEHEKDIYYNFIDAEDEAAFDTYLENLQSYAVYYDAEQEPLFGDEILTLSTCNYHTDDGRLALIAVRTDQ